MRLDCKHRPSLPFVTARRVSCLGRTNSLFKTYELTCRAFVWHQGAPQVPPLRYASVGMTKWGFAPPCDGVADGCVDRKSSGNPIWCAPTRLNLLNKIRAQTSEPVGSHKTPMTAIENPALAAMQGQTLLRGASGSMLSTVLRRRIQRIPPEGVNCQHCRFSMVCPERMRLSGLSESKCKAYAYIRLNEGKVGVSKRRYDELVKEGYAAMTAAIKDLGWHEINCRVCKNKSEA